MLRVISTVPEQRKLIVAYGQGSVEVRAPEINVNPTKIFPSRLMPFFWYIHYKTNVE